MDLFKPMPSKELLPRVKGEKFPTPQWKIVIIFQVKIALEYQVKPYKTWSIQLYFEKFILFDDFLILLNNPIKVKEKIKLLFTDKDFIVSLTQSADSSKNVKIRFSKMKNILKELKNEKDKYK